MNVLFVCSRNRLRSPTAEQVFAGLPGVYVDSAGLNHDSDNPLNHDLVQWADVIFVMEKAHQRRLLSRFRADLKNTRVICLDIPDRFVFMDPKLVEILEAKVSKHLRLGPF